MTLRGACVAPWAYPSVWSVVAASVRDMAGDDTMRGRPAL